jgi:hypothetical protein
LTTQVIAALADYSPKPIAAKIFFAIPPAQVRHADGDESFTVNAFKFSPLKTSLFWSFRVINLISQDCH